MLGNRDIKIPVSPKWQINNLFRDSILYDAAASRP